MLQLQQLLCEWHSWVGCQARQAAPPAPHAEGSLPDSQPLASQQPVGHEAGVHWQLPETQSSPAGQAIPASQPLPPVATHAPSLQISSGAQPARQAEV